MIKNKSTLFKILIFLVFAVSIFFRVTLAVVNDGSANDDHLTVSNLIYKNGRIPEPQDCWQCYHPKLYHYCVAKIWSLFKLNKILLAQLINAIASILTLFICYLFITKQTFSKRSKLLCFCMIAFNPSLIAIGSQSTNDSFIILFGAIVMYLLYKLIIRPRVIHFILLILLTILAGLTKYNSLVLIMGVIIVFVIKLLITKNFKFSLNKGYLGGLTLFLLLSIPTIGYFGEFYSNYKKYGKPIVYNTPHDKLPKLFEETYVERPGIKSIISGYFTFRIIGMIKNPIITNESKAYPLHRTSLWSQLYGRTHFLYFENWPKGKWQCSDPKMMTIGSVTLTLALLPSIVFIIGLLLDSKMWRTLLFKKNINSLLENNNWIFQIFFWGFISFIILFTAIGRDFSSMKIIYIFPGLLAVLIPLLKGFEYISAYTIKSKALFFVFHLIMFTLFVLYLIPVLNLITRLTN